MLVITKFMTKGATENRTFVFALRKIIPLRYHVHLL